ncbi:MAG: signal peptidase I [Bacteroidetes bacterium]|nr:signal peptidase I [Bacteroidota bacterium]
MHPTNFNLFLSFYIPLYLITHFGLFMLFRKAKVKMAWLAFIPVVCYWPWIQLSGRPKTWMIWAILPVSDVIIWFSLVIDMMESFGKFKFWEQVLGVIVPFFMYPFMAFDKKVTYLGKARDVEFRKKYRSTKRGSDREWADAIFFALVVAYMIRTFQFEPYKIPTSSMEDSMLVGDFLVVSKMHYGARFPNTPLAFPLVHQDIFGAKAYSEAIELPYMRLWGPQNIKRNDPVVFNVPFDLLDNTPRPPDKMQNYVKRCVGVPGDEIKIVDGTLYVNGEKAYQAPGILHKYVLKFEKEIEVPTYEALTKEYDIYDIIRFDARTLIVSVTQKDLETLKSDYKVASVHPLKSPETGNYFCPDGVDFNAIILVKEGQKMADNDFKQLGVVYLQPLDDRNFLVMMDEKFIKKENFSVIGKIDTIKSKRQLEATYNAFPLDMKAFPWNKDFYGPVYLPKRGQTIEITAQNFSYYERAIKLYEDNPSFELIDNQPHINGQPIKTYTFKMDYYWMMGDNRDNSLDSRFWGYVPENFILGKPLFVFFSIQYAHEYNEKTKKVEDAFVRIRWNRLFKSIH